ncbi:phosphoribosyltransferase [Leptolyngbya sp. AN02str]|uniref:phosphoribosyltransferase n=1 Tax=Leptolyngbya sp. AN02str TaxID=3423363 RepID=UPI003D324213
MPSHPGKFQNRTDAGQLLAARLEFYAKQPNVLVLGLPRGGVPVAYEVATALNAPLDVCLVRKLGVPGQEELAMGAIASGGVRVLNHDVVDELGISRRTIDAVTAQELRELQRRDRLYRDDRPHPEVRDRIVILVDDGIATGSTMRAAIAVIRAQHPAKLIVAVPVAPLKACHELRAEVDELVCLMVPNDFYAIGLWYQDFSQTTDETVRCILARAAHSMGYSSSHSPS